MVSIYYLIHMINKKSHKPHNIIYGVLLLDSSYKNTFYFLHKNLGIHAAVTPSGTIQQVFLYCSYGILIMKTVLVFGTFDILHPGHQWFLSNAAKHGDRLVAVVSRDEFVKTWKGTAPVKNEESRIKALISSNLVDEAVLADPEIRTYGVIHKIRPDIICLGHDQNALSEDLNSWLKHEEGEAPEIRVLRPWKRRQYSSTRRNRALRGAEGGRESKTWILSLLMVLAMITFGFSWVSGKRVSSVAQPATLACIRFMLTLLCFIPTLLGKPLPTIPRSRKVEGWITLAAAAVFISTYNLLFFLGLDAGLAGKGGLIVTTLNPLFTFVFVLFISRSRPRISAVAGICLGIAAGVLLLEPWRYSLAELADSGNLAFLAAALAWSLLTLASRKAQEILGFRRFNIGLYGISVVLTIPFALIETGGRLPSGMNAAFWLDMLFISAAVGAFGTGMYFMASSRLGAAKGSAFTYLVPVSALTFTAILLGEKPETIMIFGGILAIAAVLLINEPVRKKTGTDQSEESSN